MNIFFLSVIASVAAELHCDAHRLKMIVESTQILYTAMVHMRISVNAFTLDNGAICTPYKSTHKHHPSVLWVLGGRSHFEWLMALARSLCALYTESTGKMHLCEHHLIHIRRSVLNSSLPDDVSPEDWLVRLHIMGIPESVIASCSRKIATTNAPAGCTFGVCCINADSNGVTNTDLITAQTPVGDLVASYKAFYAFKAKCMFPMTWRKDPTPPASMQSIFACVLPEKTPLQKQDRKRKLDASRICMSNGV